MRIRNDDRVIAVTAFTVTTERHHRHNPNLTLGCHEYPSVQLMKHRNLASA
jgi:hypothetical protein